jgi:hypothetical protein
MSVPLITVRGGFGPRLGRAAGGKKGIQTVRDLVLGVLVQVAVAIECERHRGVAGSDRNFLRIRSGRHPQCHERVTQLVELEPGKARRSYGWLPPHSVEAGPAQ